MNCGNGGFEASHVTKKHTLRGKLRNSLNLMVGARGFEPPASWSRTRRSTRLSHAPYFTSVVACHVNKQHFTLQVRKSAATNRSFSQITVAEMDVANRSTSSARGG